MVKNCCHQHPHLYLASTSFQGLTDAVLKLEHTSPYALHHSAPVLLLNLHYPGCSSAATTAYSIEQNWIMHMIHFCYDRVCSCSWVAHYHTTKFLVNELYNKLFTELTPPFIFIWIAFLLFILCSPRDTTIYLPGWLFLASCLHLLLVFCGEYIHILHYC